MRLDNIEISLINDGGKTESHLPQIISTLTVQTHIVKTPPFVFYSEEKKFPEHYQLGCDTA
jgi:hypothetical protein